MSRRPVTRKNSPRLTRIAPAYMSTPMVTEMTTPVASPAKGTPKELVNESKTSRAVSMPSRATAMNATRATASGPTATASPSRPSSSRAIDAPVPFIHSSIHETRATVTSDATPPMISWPVVVSVFVP